MKILMPDYSNCLVNLMQSIRKYFNLKTTHPTLSYVDDLLNEKQYKNVVVILCDGMGSKIIDKHCKSNEFLQTHKYKDFLSTFPSTTTAATTTVKSTKTPIETGWLGWHQYFKETNEEIVPFQSVGYYDNSIKHNCNYADLIIPYKEFRDELIENGYKSHIIFPPFPHDYEAAKSFKSLVNKTLNFINQDDSKKYCYSYWHDPDHTMHVHGTKSLLAHFKIKNIQHHLKRLQKKIDDETIVFVIADHGHLDSKSINLHNYQDFLDTLVRLPSIESRNATFFVKEDRHEEFLKLFNQYFGEHFKLFTRKQVFDLELFGTGTPHPKSYDFIGDYQAASIDEYCFDYEESKKKPFKSMHAGITEDEMLIPLIVIKK